MIKITREEVFTDFFLFTYSKLQCSGTPFSTCFWSFSLPNNNFASNPCLAYKHLQEINGRRQRRYIDGIIQRSSFQAGSSGRAVEYHLFNRGSFRRNYAQRASSWVGEYFGLHTPICRHCVYPLIEVINIGRSTFQSVFHHQRGHQPVYGCS